MNGRMRLRAMVTGAALVLSIAVDLVVGYSPYPGYGASLGLGGCIGIIVISKWIGKTFLDRPEDYYVDDAPPDVQPDVLPPDHPDAIRTPTDADPAHRLDPTGGTGHVRG
jgi:hypothetical protein